MRDVLARWLVLRGFAEDVRGYGYATGDEVAKALLDDFDIRFKEPLNSRSQEDS